MGLGSKLREYIRWGRKPVQAVAQSTGLQSPAEWFRLWAMGLPTDGSSPSVNAYNALKYSVLYSCVTLITGAESSLPLITYRKSGKNGTSREKATNLRAYGVLHDEFNPRMSSQVAREALTGHLLTWGNQYSQIIRNKSGTEILEINPLMPDLVDVRLDKPGKLILYDVYDRETREVIDTLDMKDVLHVPALSFDGINGYSPVLTCKNLIRSGIAQEEEAEKFITSGIRPPGAIKFPPGKKFANEQQAIDYRNRFQKMHAGPDSQLRIMVMEDGADWVQLGIDPESAQLLESRTFTALMVCGIYHVPPHLVGIMEKTSSWGSGIGEQVDGFIKFALLPWLVKKEAEYKRKLFGIDSDVYAKYSLDALERADLAKRTMAFMQQAQMGALSRDEWREYEDRNPAPGGDVHYFPLNLGRVDEAGDDIDPPEAASAQAAPQPVDQPVKDTKQALASAIRRSYAANLSRCLRKEAERAKGWANRPSEFITLAEEFYATHATMVEDHIRGPIETWMEAFPDPFMADLGWPGIWAKAHCAASLKDLLAVAGECVPTELPAAIERLTQRWLSERAAADVAELLVIRED